MLSLDLQQAISSIKSGNKAAGRQLLSGILKIDQRNEEAWLWMSKATETVEQQKQCLRNVLRINPGNEEAKLRLSALESKAREEKDTIPQIRPENGLQEDTTQLETLLREQNYLLSTFLETLERQIQRSETIESNMSKIEEKVSRVNSQMGCGLLVIAALLGIIILVFNNYFDTIIQLMTEMRVY